MKRCDLLVTFFVLLLLHAISISKAVASEVKQSRVKQGVYDLLLKVGIQRQALILFSTEIIILATLDRTSRTSDTALPNIMKVNMRTGAIPYS
jgi:hypothetical protein